MTSRKTRRGYQETTKKKKTENPKKKLIIMFIAVFLIIFSITQVYYLAKYTFGREVPADKLGVYRWVCMLLEGNATNE